MKNNIVLIGMPGAGKSTLGVLLAKTLGRPFTDTDLVIQQNEGMLLQQLIDKLGIEKFLEIEEKSILGLDISNYIIATGGSVIYKEKAMEHLKRLGIIVYLKLSYENIEQRLNNITTRGIAMGRHENLKSLYLERLPYYEKYAGITVDCNDRGVESIIEELSLKL